MHEPIRMLLRSAPTGASTGEIKDPGLRYLTKIAFALGLDTDTDISRAHYS